MYLLDQGADIQQENGGYGTSLEVACEYGNLGVVSVLLEREPDLDMSKALFTAIKGGREDTLLASAFAA